MPDAPPPAGQPDPRLSDLRVLLIQARNTRVMEEQEQACFVERCRLRADQFHSINVVHAPLSMADVEAADAVLIGGAGEHSALNNPDWMANLLDVTRAAAERAVPTFGSCWGHQVIARAFGGRLVHDSARAELGCRWIELTGEGQRDELFQSFPARFKANTGHHDRVTDLPENAVELAFNDSQRNQAFRLEGLPVYGTQFHSELDANRERERLIAYRDFYRKDLPDETHFQEVLNSLADTTEVDHLLYDFLLRFAAKEAGVAEASATEDAPAS